MTRSYIGASDVKPYTAHRLDIQRYVIHASVSKSEVGNERRE